MLNPINILNTYNSPNSNIERKTKKKVNLNRIAAIYFWVIISCSTTISNSNSKHPKNKQTTTKIKSERGPNLHASRNFKKKSIQRNRIARNPNIAEI